MPATVLLAGYTGLSAGQFALTVTAPGLTRLSAQAGEATLLSADVAALQWSITDLVTDNMESLPVTVTTGSNTRMPAIQNTLAGGVTHLRSLHLATLDCLQVSTLKFLLHIHLTSKQCRIGAAGNLLLVTTVGNDLLH